MSALVDSTTPSLLQKDLKACIYKNTPANDSVFNMRKGVVRKSILGDYSKWKYVPYNQN